MSGPENGSGSSPSRFYAAIDAGRMECPSCTRMLLWGVSGSRRRAAQPIPDGGTWDQLTSVLTCNGCGARFQLGIVAWPFRAQKGPYPARRTPPDQRADIRQAAELRRLAGGFWPKGKGVAARSAVNVYNPVGCTCWGEKRDPACAIHGEPGPFDTDVSTGESEDDQG